MEKLFHKIISHLDALTFSLYLILAGIGAAITSFFYKKTKQFFNWAGRQLIIAGIEVIQEKLLHPFIKVLAARLDNMEIQLKELDKNFKVYKTEKHNLEGENIQLIDAIITQDKDKMKTLRLHYKEKIKKYGK